MFKESEGPTALRHELVQALSFSRGTAELETPGGDERCCAALVGVWNGKKGFVAVLVRQLDNPLIRRWAYEDRLDDQGAVATAVEAGLAFASSLGFEMDSSTFTGLDKEAQSARFDEWNALRKLGREPSNAHDTPTSSEVSSPITADEHGGAVLGRLSLVRKGGNVTALARLLSYF